LVSEIVALDSLQERAVEIASAIAAQSTAITPYAKKAVRAADEYPLAEGLLVEHQLTVEAFDTEDRMEGLRAFAEKRKPKFHGR
ncbi:enoyl-CoA hydratase-related protein, partial [Shinella sp.]|uniref:enoyl-CoA hydratase-related protein n=1 Tax=Shinella sp. TaxID=1870904 RepID=UPI00289CDC48